MRLRELPVEQRPGTQLEVVLLYLHMEVSCFRIGVRKMSRCSKLPVCSQNPKLVTMAVDTWIRLLSLPRAPRVDWDILPLESQAGAEPQQAEGGICDSRELDQAMGLLGNPRPVGIFRRMSQ